MFYIIIVSCLLTRYFYSFFLRWAYGRNGLYFLLLDALNFQGKMSSCFYKFGKGKDKVALLPNQPMLQILK